MKKQLTKNMHLLVSLSIAPLFFALPNISIANHSPTLDITLPVHVVTNNKTSELKAETSNELESSAEVLSSPEELAKPVNPLKQLQERYLTIHYGKTEKIQAVYNQGVYGIAYQQTW